MGNDIRKTVDFSLYLDVLRQLPEVTDEDIAETKKAFEGTYGKLPDEITFDIGFKKGDGEIYAFQRINDDFGRSYRTKLYIDEKGAMENRDTGYKGRIPFPVARYFISSLFGSGELNASKGNPFVDAVPEEGCWGMPNPGVSGVKLGHFDAHPKCDGYVEDSLAGLLSPHFDELARGAWLLYESADKNGGLDKAGKCEGMKAIEGVKGLVAGQLHVMAEEVWEDAAKVVSTAKVGPGSAKEAELEGIEKKYAAHEPKDAPPAYEQAAEGYAASVEMMKDIAALYVKAFRQTMCVENPISDNKKGFKCSYGVDGGFTSVINAGVPK